MSASLVGSEMCIRDSFRPRSRGPSRETAGCRAATLVRGPRARRRSGQRAVQLVGPFLQRPQLSARPAGAH
eukprot:12812130-Alexandrium_andersonii.AAC.1